MDRDASDHDEAAALTPRELQRRAAGGVAWTMAHTVTALPLAFAVNVILARVLGVVDYGRLALLTTILELASLIAGAGISAALLQFGAKAHASGRSSTVKELLMRTQGFRLLVMAPLVTAVVVLFANVPPILLLSAVVFGVWLPAFLAGASVTMAIENRTAAGAKVAMFLNIVSQGAVLIAVLATESPDVVWNARMIVAGLGPLISLALISKAYRKAVIQPRPPRPMLPGFWRFALPTGISSIVTTLAVSRSEVLLLQHWSTPEQVGLYAMAFGLAMHILAPAQALINPLTPAISGLRETGISMIGRAFERVSRVSSTLAGFIAAVGGPALALAVPIVYGVQFARASPLVLVLTFVATLLFTQSTMIPFVAARLRGASLLYINLGSFVPGVLVGALLIPSLGAWGAVWGKVVMMLIRHALLFVYERHSFHSSLRSYLRSVSPVGLGLVAGGAAYLPAALGLIDGMYLVALPLVGFVVFVALLRGFRVGLHVSDANQVQELVAFQPAISWTVRKCLYLVANAR